MDRKKGIRLLDPKRVECFTSFVFVDRNISKIVQGINDIGAVTVLSRGDGDTPYVIIFREDIDIVKDRYKDCTILTSYDDIMRVDKNVKKEYYGSKIAMIILDDIMYSYFGIFN